MLNDITLGQYFPGNSAIHRMDPRMKLILTILYIVGVFIVANLPGYAIALAFLYIVVRISGIKFSYLAKGVKPLRFIIIFTFILNLFFVQGETPIFTLGFFTLTKEALNNAIYFALRLVFLVDGHVGADADDQPGAAHGRPGAHHAPAGEDSLPGARAGDDDDHCAAVHSDAAGGDGQDSKGADGARRGL